MDSDRTPLAPEGYGTYLSRPLDTWYIRLNGIFIHQNFNRSPFAIFGHLVEVVGGLSLLGSEKRKPNVDPSAFVPKALAWWMALCGKVGIRSVSQMLWWKFPAVCTYCHKRPHVAAECRHLKAGGEGPRWSALEEIGEANEGRRPKTLTEWNRMFDEIYPIGESEPYPAVFARFSEELGELAEALRVFPVEPRYFLSEAADVFAWLMHLQNLIYFKEGIAADRHGLDFVETLAAKYPDRCGDCGSPVCICPAILPSTLGRIAHEAPQERASFAPGGALLQTADALELFEARRQVITVGGQQLPVDGQLIAEVRQGVGQLLRLAVGQKEDAGFQNQKLFAILYELERMARTQQVSAESVEDLAREISAMPSEDRRRVESWLAGVTANAFTTALLAAVRSLGS